MTRKRRTFDIELPEDDPAVFPAGKTDGRRGPMAAAIAETAETARDRARIEAEIRAENDALAAEHVRLKQAGLITDLIDLDAIDTGRLIRDRAPGPDPDLFELVESIRDLGLSNPIRVEQTGNGRYELIEGWRRLSAFRHLRDTDDAGRWGRIPAGIIAKGAALDELYRRMVDENLVRKDISFGEMAQLAARYAADPATGESDADKAVAILFRSAGYQKRSYIRRFIPIVNRLGDTLLFLPEVPRALGLALSQRLEDDQDLGNRIIAELEAMPDRSARDELEVLRRQVGQGVEPALSDSPPAPPPNPASTVRARMTFQVARPQGSARCIAANGRLEIRLAKDFSAVDLRRIESAVRTLLDQIE